MERLRPQGRRRGCQKRTFSEITTARVNDITVAKQMPLEAGATDVVDQGYGACPRAGQRPDPGDFSFWTALDARGCRFVTRRKVNTAIEALETRAAPDDLIRADRIRRLPGRLARNRHNPCPKPVRLITVVREGGKTLDLLTNDLEAGASPIAALYKGRWQAELFFRWVK